MITQERLKELLHYDSDTGVLTWLKRPSHLFKTPKQCAYWNSRYAGKTTGVCDGKGYLHVKISGKLYRFHRVVWAIYYGIYPDGQIDHINGDRTDNRISNLRDVSASENKKNMKRASNNKSGVTGVGWSNYHQRWNAHISINKKLVTLGRFEEFDDAVKCRKNAERVNGYHKNHDRHTCSGKDL